MADETVQTVVTSPPYWGLRDYGLGKDALGLEPTPEMYVQHMVEIFREVRRVMKSDGTVWLNLGDTYSRNPQKGDNSGWGKHADYLGDNPLPLHSRPCSTKPKDLVGIPWRVAFALQADGWWLRSDIIWSKPNPMPESVTDRPTKAHEYIFLLSKSERYYWDRMAVAEPAQYAEQHANKETSWGTNRKHPNKANVADYAFKGDNHTTLPGGNRNVRSVWEFATQPYSGAHFATFPEAIPERCIKAGSRPGDLVLDPFGGSGTVGRVAERLNRRWVCMDLKPEYHELAMQRTSDVQKELIL